MGKQIFVCEKQEQINKMFDGNALRGSHMKN